MSENWSHLPRLMLLVEAVCLCQQPAAAAADLLHHLTSVAVLLTVFQQMLT